MAKKGRSYEIMVLENWKSRGGTAMRKRIDRYGTKGLDGIFCGIYADGSDQLCVGKRSPRSTNATVSRA